MAAVLRFGSVELHPTQRHLLVRGEAVPVGARAFDVLLALAEHSGELVTKQQLLDLVWRGLVVEENNLQVQVAALRRLLGAEAIATIPGLGYRLTLERSDAPDGRSDAPQARLETAALETQASMSVNPGEVNDRGLEAEHLPILSARPLAASSTHDEPRAGPALPRGWRRLANAAAVALIVVAAAWLMQVRQAATEPGSAEAPLQSVMLAPFSPAAGDLELATEAQRLTVDVTRALGDTLRDVRVAPSAAATSIAARTSDLRTMAREANVRFIIEGELRESGSDVVAIVRLFDAHEARQLLTERHSVRRERLAMEHDAFARQITAFTRVMFWTAVVKATPQVDEAKASAQELIDQIDRLRIPDAAAWTREVFRLADEAIRRDPKLAAAWTYRADARVGLVWNDFDFNRDREPTLADADADTVRALLLDDRQPGAWVSRGRVLAARGNLEAALLANDRAQQLDPTPFYPVVARGWLYYVGGRHLEVLKVADSLPSHIDDRIDLACAAHVQLGAYDLAAAECERAAFGGDFWLIYANLTATHAMRGDAAKAAQAKAKLLAAAPSFTISRYERHRSFTDPDAIARDREHMVAGLRKAGVPE